jgi:UDP-N-acetylmuramate--alanine ligase
MYQKKHIHFIGIGGIGMSGIAKVLKQQGYDISGCDKNIHQKSIYDLQALGCMIHEGNNTPSCINNQTDIVVYSSAIQPHNPEVVLAQKKGIPTIARALMLAEIMRTKYSIAIAGSHGKTTTTSLVSHIFLEAHKDPTVIIGGHLQSLSSNAQSGSGDFIIAEADESDRSLTHLHPTIAVLTNIDFEHVDTYKDIDDIVVTFKQFLNNIPFYGKAIVCADDPHIQKLLPELTHIKTIRYGLHNDTSSIYAQKISLEKDRSVMTIYNAETDTTYEDIIVNIPGKHNALNALAAFSIALYSDIDPYHIKKGLETFKGVDRRFTYKGTYKKADVFDDYGHHPTEIYNTLITALNRCNNKLHVVFQPHKYSRTQHLWRDFVHVFAYASIDNLIITDIYPAHEKPIPGITSSHLVEEILFKNPACNVTYVSYDESFLDIITHINDRVQPNDLILTLGAGKITLLSKKISL